MTVWDAMTWAALAVLGPGALLIFALFLRDLLQLRAPPRRNDVRS